MKFLALILILSVAVILLWSFISCETSEETKFNIEIINYHGWNESYKLSNYEIEVVVVPAIGRIMSFGFKGGNNVLWNNPAFYGKSLPPGKPMTENGKIIWANFGGDKVWPIQEHEREEIVGYRWPTDHWFDGSSHEVETIEKGIRIISPVSEYCGARSIREITLGNAGAEIIIKQTIEKIEHAQKKSVEPINYTIWNVTQIRTPLMALFNLNPNSKHPDRYVMIKPNTIDNFSVKGDIGILIPDNQKEQKAGADSDHWLAAIVEDVVFAEFFRLRPELGYPDNGLSAEVYTEQAYTELELLSPLKQLSIGESLEFSIIWRIHKLSADNKTDVQKRMAAVAWLNSFVELSK